MGFWGLTLIHEVGLMQLVRFFCLVLLIIPFYDPVSLYAQDGDDSAGPVIKWVLENPFRLFKSAEMTNFHQILYDQLEAKERALPILSLERRLSAHLPRGWAEGLINDTCWSRGTGAFTGCGKAERYLHPREHKVRVQFEGIAFAARGALTCHWQLLAIKGSKVLGDQSHACDQIVDFQIPYPSGGRIKLRVSDGTTFEKIIRVKDIFVVALGDSFASGEGNPDVPVELARDRHVFYGNSSVDYFANRGYPTRVGDWKLIGDNGFMENKALWTSQACHRSLYSHQLRASLQLAIEDPQRAVTFVSFACAGAQITHGLFRRFKGNEWSLTPPTHSQISAAALAQCGGRGARLTRYARAFGINGRLETLHDLDVYNCHRRKARKIDLLMVSIGGNDVGFSSLVANVVVKDSNKLKAVGGWMGRVLSALQARAHFKELKLRYKALNRAFHNVLHIPWQEADRIVVTAYPNMSFRDEGRRVCGDGVMGMDVAPLFSMSHRRARDAETFADQLNEVMRGQAKRFKWTFVEGHRPLFLDHGICASLGNGAVNFPEQLAMPFYVNGSWVPYNPADFKPYASRLRWFRTPNDAYLTGHLHLSGPLIRSLTKIKGFDRLQVLIAGTYSGAFHPTAEGQAVIADHLKVAAQKVLEKYGQ